MTKIQRLSLTSRRHVRSAPMLALSVVAGGACALTPPGTPSSDRGTTDAVAAWRERLLNAAEEAERHLGTLLSAAIGTSDATPARANGLHLIQADHSEVAVSPAVLAPALRPDGRVVLLIHGLDEPGSIWDELIPALQDADYTIVRFDYPNDQAAVTSADLLADALATLHASGCRRVDLVCHSMGGLLALDVLTRPAFDKARASWPRFERYITLGTPFGGSPFARLRALAEVRDRVERWLDSDRKDRDAILDWSSDGNGEAGDDLMPGSHYLKDLTSRSLPEGLAATAIIARMADVTPPDLSPLTDSWMFRRIAGDAEVESIAAALRRAALEVGDGVVPESSARAVLIQDTVVVTANHRDMIGSIGPLDTFRRAVDPNAPKRVPPAIPIILERLAAEFDDTQGPASTR